LKARHAAGQHASAGDINTTDQLIRACRKIRPDAQAEEIAYFVRENLELTRNNRNITNPIGLILATVQQSFSGYSFDTFRQRRQESKRLAEPLTQAFLHHQRPG
jgi:hypothetical protein